MVNQEEAWLEEERLRRKQRRQEIIDRLNASDSGPTMEEKYKNERRVAEASGPLYIDGVDGGFGGIDGADGGGG